MRELFAITFLLFAGLTATGQTIQVNPTGVNVNAQNPTTVFLTFGQIPAGYVPAEALWCGQIAVIPPALGPQCVPGTNYGSLPARFDLSRGSGSSGMTDIMSIPSSVVRRAFQVGASGGDAGFFYVRRFISTLGGPDQYVAVTCRMGAGGARTPFSLIDVEYVSLTDEPIVFLKRGEKLPIIGVDIRHNGTGRLKGRWELVLPGEEIPTEKDLLTEGTLPIEERANQRRYTQVERFNHFLPPTGKFRLELKNTANLPLTADGQYLLLLRIEVVDDKEGDSNLAAVGVGPGVVNSGAVAGFPMPTFKFFVRGGSNGDWDANGLIGPSADSVLAGPLIFTWRPFEGAAFFRVEFLEAGSEPRFQALLPSSQTIYRAPPWLGTKFTEKAFRWRVIAIDERGMKVGETGLRAARLQ